MSALARPTGRDEEAPSVPGRGLLRARGSPGSGPGAGRGGVDQYSSEEMISPPARLPSFRMVLTLVLSLRNLTDPSAIRMFAPPGWKLLIENTSGASMVFFPLVEQFGTL